MMRKLLLLLSLLSAWAFSAEIKNVDYSCGSKDCSLKFQFASAKNLPNFFQKYDAGKHQLTIGFSDTKLVSGDASYVVDAKSKGLRSVRIFTDASFKVPLLNFEFDVGPDIHNDKNPVSLSKGKYFVISFPKTKSASWSLKKAVAENAKASEVKSVAAKKAKSDSLKAAKLKAEAEKKAKSDSIAAAKKAKADSLKAAKLKAEAEKKAKSDSIAAAKKAKADSIAAAKQARLDSIREEKEQSKKKVVSALIEGIQEMTGIQSHGIEQFRIDTDSDIELSMVQNREKSSIIHVNVPGPKKTPMFNVSTSNIVKSVTWMSSGLRIQLQKNVQPLILVYKGSLILQISHMAKTPGFVCYMAKPSGVYVRKWTNPSAVTESFADFSKNMDQDKKKLVTVSQSFGLRPVARNLIVVAEATPFLTKPSENAQELETLEFGVRLEDIELDGLYHKVRLGSKIGYVNRRAVSFPDELSAVQSERLKQIALEKGGTLDSNAVHFDRPIEERISYSSFGRRDPFIEIKGLMEEGINIDQVELVGIIWESEVPIAILAETKNPSVSYAVKEGDRILNGKVLKITQTDVLFLLQEFGVSRRYSMSLPDKYGRDAK
ncbi:hypothetical protein [Hallerella succinigenes]|uniref:hypothetical protein n=1 Tax=Hallerella succinigenes TaxID=1896222 RepID=UPI002A815A95|nr:hypothetical protein [Hallerella succinigenes]MDY5028687.1 hypothetical protein [Hallerella succinigenes]